MASWYVASTGKSPVFNRDCNLVLTALYVLHLLYLWQVQQSLTVGDGQGRALAVQVQVYISAFALT
jgi:hypothetical protein